MLVNNLDLVFALVYLHVCMVQQVVCLKLYQCSIARSYAWCRRTGESGVAVSHLNLRIDPR